MTQVSLEQLQKELAALRQENAQLKALNTDYKQTMLELGSAHQKLEFLIDNSVLAVIEWDSDFRVCRWSRGAEQIFGWSAEEVMGKHPSEWPIIYPDDVEAVDGVIARLLNGTEQHNISFNRNCTKSGAILSCEWFNSVMLNDVGQMLSFLSLALDRTKQIEALAAMHESAERFDQLAKSIEQVFWFVELNPERVLYLSPSFETIWGRQREEVYANPRIWIDSIYPEDRQRVRTLLETWLQAPTETSYTTEFRVVRPDGTLRWIYDTGTAIYNDKGELYRVSGIARDITDSKIMEEQLLQAQKLESLGRLAGGVAHDFNNMLTAIQGFAELAEEDIPFESPAVSHLRNIRTASDRASNLTMQLLAFARKQVIALKVVELHKLITETLPIVRRLIGEHVEMTYLPASDTGNVKIDPGQFSQILLNLALNARDAMPQGGKLLIETSNVTLEDSYASTHSGVTPGDYVLLGVSDTGQGMSEETLKHIFEPFYTTKEVGHGLGLASCYGIVQQLKGHIWVYSEMGQGTTFKIYLPRVEAPAATVLARPSTLSSSHGTETILLVEDEEMVRELAVQTLRRSGYHVLEAQNGLEAIEVAKAHLGHLHLLLTDVVMPQMNGTELAKALQTLRPGLKVVYVSGYTENTIVHQGILKPNITFLQKPYTPSRLAEKVRSVLDVPNTV